MTLANRRRRPVDAGLMVGGAAVLTASALVASRGVYGWEVAVFQAVNDLPNALRPVFWLLNQFGTVVTIPVLTAAALIFRRWYLAASLAISGMAVYLLARVIEEYVTRGRPPALVAGTVAREVFAPGSLGFPSGHAAVGWAIAIIGLAYLGRPWRIAAVVLATVVLVSRMYVGAHLPLDLIGGAALGVTVASLVNLLFGVPESVSAHEARAGPAHRDVPRSVDGSSPE